MKPLVLTFWGLLFPILLEAQNTLSEQGNELLFNKASSLYAALQFTAAHRKFETYPQAFDAQGEAVSALFYAAFSAFELENPDGLLRINRLLKHYPDSEELQKAHYRLAGYYYNRAEYEKVIAFLDGQITSFRTADDLRAGFQLAYAYFSRGDYGRALPILDMLKEKKGDLGEMASYYAAYIAFKQGNMEEALQNLEISSIGRAFRTESNLLKAAIYYAQKKCDDVLFFVEELNKKNKSIPDILYLFAGDCYFKQGNFENTIVNISKYLSGEQAEQNRGVHYRLGYAALNTGRLPQAITSLRIAADAEDALAQAAAYHLGVAHLMYEEKELAVGAFDKCRKLAHNPEIQEMAAFLYLKINFDLQNFTNTLKGTDFYNTEFPQGKYLGEVVEFSTNSYLRTGNYAEALQRIRKFKPKTDKLKRVHQIVAYNQAARHHADSEFEQAAQMLKESLGYPRDKTLKDLAYFWLGEIYQTNAHYDSAAQFYKKIGKKSEIYQKALYGLGYVYYNSNDYGKAGSYFIEYLGTQPKNEQSLLDALVLLANCFYAKKEYQNALNLYARAIEKKSDNLGYIYYQKGLTYRAMGWSEEANAAFDVVISDHPTSEKRDDALLQKGMLYFEAENRPGAILAYSKMINEHPKSKHLLDAYAKRALAYKITKQIPKAIADYKQILDTDPSHESAESAILSLQEIKAEYKNGVKNINHYVHLFNQANPRNTVIIVQALERAKKPFEEGNYKLAINTLSNFIKNAGEASSSPSYVYDAYYFLGYSYEREGNIPAAQKSYQKVLGGAYKSRSIRNLADLYYAEEEYKKAITHYLSLKNATEEKRYTKMATYGLMRAYFAIEDYKAAKSYADEIISRRMKRYETAANLYLGKILFATGKYDDALFKLQALVSSTSHEDGAEAQYNIGCILRTKEQFNQSTRAFIQVAKKYEGYTKWIHKAYLLIAENYVDLGNVFQAKETLKSIVNYSKNSKVRKTAQARIKALEANQ